MTSTTSPRVSISNHTRLTEADYPQYFVDPANGNFTPKSGAFPFAVGASLNMNQVAPDPVFVSNVTTPTPTPTPAPTLSPLTITPATLVAPGTLTLSWTSTNATACTASGDWTGSKVVNGNATVSMTTPGTKSFTLTCTGAGGSKAVTQAYTVTSATPTPTPTPAPTLSLSLSPATATVNQLVNITWSSQNATSCVATGDWLGNKVTAGTEQLTQSTVGIKSFTLTCTGAGGSKAVTQAYTVTSVATSTPITTNVTLRGIGGTLRGTETIEARVDKRVLPSDITFLIDGVVVLTDITAPYTLDLDTTKYTDGRHQLEVRVTTAAGTDILRRSFEIENTRFITPASTSTTPTGSAMVTTINNLNVRTVTGGLISIQPQGSDGVVDTSKRITRNGITFVYVDFTTGSDGYVAETYLTTKTGIPPIIPTTPAAGGNTTENNELLLKLLQEVLRLLMILRELKGGV